MEQIELKIFRQHSDFLEERIEPDYGLLDQLRVNKTLTDKEIKEIKCKDTHYGRNAKILECIFNNEKCDQLSLALRKTQQIHIVNFLKANGKWNAEFGDEWPLTEKEIEILVVNWESLVDLLDTSDVLVQMYSEKIVNKRQMDFITSKLTSYDKNEAFLDILRRRSLRDFKSAIHCLRECNQWHIAVLLEEGGVIVQVHSQHPTSSPLIDKTEDEITIKFKNTDRGLEEVNRKLRDIGLRVVDVRKDRSIVLYIFCKTLAEVMRLKEMQLSGQLATVVKWFFLQLLSPTQYVEVVYESTFTALIADFSVTLFEDQYIKCRSYDFFPGIIVRAVRDFDCNEIKESSNSSSQDNETEWNIKDSESRHRKEAMSFRKGDQLKAISANICDGSEWWMAIHLDNRQVGYIPRSHVVIDYETRTLHSNWLSNLGSPEKSPKEELINVISETRVNDLPFELLDAILQKSYLLLSMVMPVIKSCQDQVKSVICRLALVESSWFERIIKGNFKRKARRNLIAFYRKERNLTAIYRNNRSFFDETTETKNLILQLKSMDCLTDAKSMLLRRQKQRKKKKVPTATLR